MIVTYGLHLRGKGKMKSTPCINGDHKRCNGFIVEMGICECDCHIDE